MPRHADYSHTSDCSSFEIANRRTLIVVGRDRFSRVKPERRWPLSEWTLGSKRLPAYGQFCGPEPCVKSQIRIAVVGSYAAPPHAQKKIRRKIRRIDLAQGEARARLSICDKARSTCPES